MSEIKPSIALACYEFRDGDGQYRKVTAIIVPIKMLDVGSETRITYACSKGRACHNDEECEYAYGRRGPL